MDVGLCHNKRTREQISGYIVKYDNNVVMSCN